MNKNINFTALAAELAALEKQGKGHGEDLLIARVLHNMSPSRWKEFCSCYPASNWGAVPVSSLPLAEFADREESENFGDELVYAISAEKFTAQVDRELVRLNRTGGEISLINAKVLSRTESARSKELRELMIELLRKHLEPCDSMATDQIGNPLIVLPGTGPVRSRHLAEQLQREYSKKMTQLDVSAFLTIGLVSIAQGEKIAAEDFVQKVLQALEKAVDERTHLYQIGPEALDERSSLVHSDEKRFLFFGGA